MNLNELIEIWKREEQQPFTGWDFSYLAERMLEDQTPWSYSRHAAELMRQASSVIDPGHRRWGTLAQLARFLALKSCGYGSLSAQLPLGDPTTYSLGRDSGGCWPHGWINAVCRGRV